MLARRGFLAGAVLATFTLRPALAGALPADMKGQERLDGWIRIDAPGRVTVFTGKAELGQGIYTALSQIAADCMGVAFERIHLVGADTAQTPNEGMTAGSMSVEYGGEALRTAAAEARAALLAAAAAAGGVPQERLVVEDGTIHDPQTGWSTTYWDVAGGGGADGLLHRDATGDVPTLKPDAYRAIGQSVPRIDIPPKVRGGEAYVQDMRLPGTVHGRVVRPPS